MAYLRLLPGRFDAAALRGPVERYPDGSVTVPLRTRLLVGRGGHCDLVVASGRCSREEAVLEPVDGGWWVMDLGNNQGTYVNRQKVLRHPLRHGDQFTLGPALFEFLEEVAPRAE